MIEIILFEPQIPQNTGNIIRLCSNTGSALHIIHPTGFGWNDKKLKRAMLDYEEFSQVSHYESWQDFLKNHDISKIWAFTTKGEKSVFKAEIKKDDFLLFGSETAGLSAEIHKDLKQEQKIRLPMQRISRSMNLSNSVAVGLYEAMRQNKMLDEIFL